MSTIGTSERMYGRVVLICLCVDIVIVADTCTSSRMRNRHECVYDAHKDADDGCLHGAASAVCK